MKLSINPNKNIVNNEISNQAPSLQQIIYPIIILSLGLVIPTSFYYIYRYLQSKENSNYVFLSIFNFIKKWRNNLENYQETIVENTRLNQNTNINSDSSTSHSPSNDTELKNLLENSKDSKDLTNSSMKDNISNITNNKSTIVKSILSKSNLLYTKLRNRFEVIYFISNKCKDFSICKIKSLRIIPIHKSYFFNYVRNKYFIIQYFIVSYSDKSKSWLAKEIKRLPFINKKKDIEVETSKEENINDITKLFNTTFDNLINDDFINQPLISGSPLPSSSSGSQSLLSQSTSQSIQLSKTTSSQQSQSLNKKFHIDYYSNKIIFHPNSIYHEQNAKKYNSMEANIEKDQLFSSVTVILTTCNQKELSYFPRYPWYWDGVELFNGISVHPKPFYHPNYLSVIWKPKTINFNDLSPTLNSLSLSLPSSPKPQENEKNKRNFTLSLTRTNSF